MHINDIAKKYNMGTTEQCDFFQYLKNSNYKYTSSLWKGCVVDDSEDIESIVQTFRNDAKKKLEADFAQRKNAASEQSKLISCPDCGKQISRRASVCIHCGCPISEADKNITQKFYGVKRISDKWVMGKAVTFINRAGMINGQATGIKDLDIIASGITKERAELLLDYLVSHKGEGEIFEDVYCTQENEEMTFYIDRHLNPNAPIKCPRCRSTEVIVGQRGYSLLSGFIGSNKTVNRCGKCGFSWEP